jgi:D-alanyl-D-alanine dipeptidase
MHIWKDASTGTAGCTAMERSNLEKILDWIRPELNPYLIQMPEKEYKYHWRFWGGSAALPSLK